MTDRWVVVTGVECGKGAAEGEIRGKLVECWGKCTTVLKAEGDRF